MVAVGLLVVLISIAGAGLLLGSMAGDGQQGTAERTETQAEASTETAAPEPSEPTATESIPEPTRTPASTRTPDQPEQYTVNQSAIVEAIGTQLDEDRSPTNGYRFESQTASTLSEMAETHSTDMANERFLSHNVGNGNSRDRYQQNDLFNQCQFQVDEYIVDASSNRLEAIGRASIDDHTGTVGSVEQSIATAIVEDWRNSATYSERISYENAEDIGIGVAVSSDNEVYATVNVC